MGAPKFYDTRLSRASAHPSIFMVLWVFKLLRVTAHHAWWSRKPDTFHAAPIPFSMGTLKAISAADSKVHRAHVHCSSEHSDEFQVPLHSAGRFAHTGCSLVRSVLRLQYEIRVQQATDAANPGNETSGWFVF